MANANAQSDVTWQAIPFGSMARHVDVDFSVSTPEAVTQMLVSCLRSRDGAAPDVADIWQWPVATRIQGLLQIALHTDARALDVDTHCWQCNERLSLELALEDLVQPAVTPTFRLLQASGDPIQLRLPTGADQLRWLQQSQQTETPTAGGIARTLLLNDAPPDNDSWLQDAEEYLEQADPLSALELHSQCPACGAAQHIPMDLEQSLLDRFRSVLSGTLRDVHRLANAYHWSEADILNLPLSRKRFYLACIGQRD